jgi:hypothetical protein
MTPTPDFNDLTPPHDLTLRWIETARPGIALIDSVVKSAARWGARHGYEQARQLWPEPITDRPPTEADGDEYELVQCLDRTVHWHAYKWNLTLKGQHWLHTPRWQPRQPSLKEQALAKVGAVLNDRNKVFLDDVHEALELARRALEQAGEAQP